MRLVQIDSFTSTPFSGNPAGVCVVDAWPSDKWMQDVAAEMNLAETAFVLPDREGGYGLRWFTPLAEVDLCGHATLAAAHHLWESGTHPLDGPIRFATRSGTLGASREGDWIALDFPRESPSPAEVPGIEEAIGRRPVWTGRNRMDVIAVFESEEQVRALAPDLNAIAAIDARGVIATAAADKSTDADFVSRFFAPRVGVPEDPVTGSAHCCLAPFWSQRFDRIELTGYQASRRGGFVRTRINGDRVTLLGQAVTVFDARFAREVISDQ
ncbi:MAG: PhzF family phenazine biosynthesis protein [Rhodothermales bacterium]